MKHHRFVTSLACAQDVHLADPRIVHQVFSVLKIAIGETLVLCDGKGEDYYYRLGASTRRVLDLHFLEKKSAVPEFSLDITLYCSILKSDHFDLVIQKATELGVRTITPIIAERTIKKNINLERCTAIAQEASEQCGRGIVPSLLPPLSYMAAHEHWGTFERVFVADIFETVTASPSPHNYSRVALCIGPEGGWSPAEKTLHDNSPFVTPLTLSPFVLRAETAAIVGLSTLINRYAKLS